MGDSEQLFNIVRKFLDSKDVREYIAVLSCEKDTVARLALTPRFKSISMFSEIFMEALESSSCRKRDFETTMRPSTWRLESLENTSLPYRSRGRIGFGHSVRFLRGLRPVLSTSLSGPWRPLWLTLLISAIVYLIAFILP
ncbi:MAG: hypothetical protein ABWW69_04640 [Pyrodictiaceae archaeon]